MLLLTDITNSSSEQISITVASYNGLDGDIDGTLEIYQPEGNWNYQTIVIYCFMSLNYPYNDLL